MGRRLESWPGLQGILDEGSWEMAVGLQPGRSLVRLHWCGDAVSQSCYSFAQRPDGRDVPWSHLISRSVVMSNCSHWSWGIWVGNTEANGEASQRTAQCHPEVSAWPWMIHVSSVQVWMAWVTGMCFHLRCFPTQGPWGFYNDFFKHRRLWLHWTARQASTGQVLSWRFCPVCCLHLCLIWGIFNVKPLVPSNQGHRSLTLPIEVFGIEHCVFIFSLSGCWNWQQDCTDLQCWLAETCAAKRYAAQSVIWVVLSVSDIQGIGLI